MAEATIPFGKTHKGKPISECPTEYLDWLIGQDWLRPALRREIEAHLETRADWHRMGTED